MLSSSRWGKRNEGPAGFPAGLKLAWEEREQEYDQMYYLLVAQLKLYSQFKHGINLVCAGLQANLLKVGIYKAPCLALAFGLPRMALSGSLIVRGYPFLLRFTDHCNRTLSRAVTRQLGLLAQVRYVAHCFVMGEIL